MAEENVVNALALEKGWRLAKVLLEHGGVLFEWKGWCEIWSDRGRLEPRNRIVRIGGVDAGGVQVVVGELLHADVKASARGRAIVRLACRFSLYAPVDNVARAVVVGKQRIIAGARPQARDVDLAGAQGVGPGRVGRRGHRIAEIGAVLHV